ncbi:MAG: CehA/McbA family metallohydrolase [Pseudomonadota bacterium]
MRQSFNLIITCILLTLSLVALSHNEHPLGRKQIPFESDENILRVLAYNFDFAGGGDFVTWRAPGGVEKRDSRECLVGPYFFFDVRDDFAFNTDEEITLELLFDREITEGFNLSYDQAVKPTVISREFKDTDARWHTEKVKLSRARFANRKYGKTDFAIGGLKSLFPADNSGGGHRIALCDLKISRDNKKSPTKITSDVRLTITNEQGEPTAARVGIYSSDGRAPLAAESALAVRRFNEEVRDLPLRTVPRAWPSVGRFTFYVDGSYETALAPGRYTMVISKGPEYRLNIREFEISNNGPKSIDVKLERWMNMPAKGWYSGDDHIHIKREDPAANKGIMAFVGAEDLHLSNLLQMANVTTWHFPQYAFGNSGHYIKNDRAIIAGQESPRTSHRGHTIGLNGKRFHWPEKDYFLYDKTADQIHADGGLFGYAHVAIDGFNVSWGLALDVPLGIVDFLEMLQMGVLNTEYLYDFLNLGYKLLPSAGSDYPYIHIAGAERVYAKVGNTFSVDRWFNAWRNKRSFISNAPVIEFQINGDHEAREYELNSGESISIVAEADVNPDFDQLERLELVIHGAVVATAGRPASGSVLKLTHTTKAEESIWLALRTYGANGTVAHSAPVYIYVDGNKAFWNKENAEGLALKYIDILNTLKNSEPTLKEEWERFNVENDVLPKWHQSKPTLDIDIDRAMEKYRSIIETARGESRPIK